MGDAEGAIDVLLLANIADMLDVQSLVLFLVALEDSDEDYKSSLEATGRLDLNSCSSQSKEEFRFLPDQICNLSTALRVPHTMISTDRTTWTGLEGLYILPRKPVYPHRLKDLVATFGRPVIDLSIIANTTCPWIYRSQGYVLDDFVHQTWRTQQYPINA